MHGRRIEAMQEPIRLGIPVNDIRASLCWVTGSISNFHADATIFKDAKRVWLEGRRS